MLLLRKGIEIGWSSEEPDEAAGHQAAYDRLLQEAIDLFVSTSSPAGTSFHLTPQDTPALCWGRVDRTSTAEVVPFAIKAGTLIKVCLVQAWRMLRQQDVRAPQQPHLLTGPGSARRLICAYHHPSYSPCSSSGMFLPCWRNLSADVRTMCRPGALQVSQSPQP